MCVSKESTFRRVEVGGGSVREQLGRGCPYRLYTSVSWCCFVQPMRAVIRAVSSSRISLGRVQS